jgi:major membrane immunogen (membrane-anchored lipoprotein)
MKLKLFLVISIFLLGACSKEKEDEKPRVIITHPAQFYPVNGIDTIQVLASISDDQNIEWVAVSLRDDNGINVLQSVVKRPNTSSYDLNVSYFFNDLQLEGGTYQLNVSAFDGEHTTTEYVAIVYNETPQTREGVFVVSNSPSITSFYLLDQNYSAQFYQSVEGDHLKTSVDAYHQQLIHSSATHGSIQAIDLLSNNLNWSLPLLNPLSAPFYTGFYHSNQNVYLGKRNGGIQGIDKNGNPNFYTPIVNPGFYTEQMHIHKGQYLVAEERSINTTEAFLVFYFLASGARDVQTTLVVDVKGIYSKGNNIVLIANNAEGNGEVLIYDFPSSVINTVFNSSLGEVEDCMEISSGIYLVSESGNLTIVNTLNHTTSSYLDNIGAQRIWYDAITDELYVGNGGVLTIYDFSDKLLKASYTHSSEIKEVNFWYNK